jgi:hypothetical protein
MINKIFSVYLLTYLYHNVIVKTIETMINRNPKIYSPRRLDRNNK